MPLSIETAEADGLARNLAELTGESIADAITRALRERLERERIRRGGEAELTARVTAWARGLRGVYDTRLVSKDEWDAACGEVERDTGGMAL